MTNLHGFYERKSIRLFGYDYHSEGAYFVTFCTQKRQCLLGDAFGNEIRLNDAGLMIQSLWEALPNHYQGIVLDAFVIMPNHVHGIIVIDHFVGADPCVCPHDEQGRTRGSAPTINEQGRTRGSAPTINEQGRTQGLFFTISLAHAIQRFKSLTTRRYIDGVRRHHWPAFNGQLWQRNYHDRIIRNEDDLRHIRDYITENPAQWAFDYENPNHKGSLS